MTNTQINLFSEFVVFGLIFERAYIFPLRDKCHGNPTIGTTVLGFNHIYLIYTFVTVATHSRSFFFVF